MDWLLELRPIRFFSFYLALIFILGVVRRWQQYRAILRLVVRLRSRWPNLAQLVLVHKHIFLTWGTLRPLILVAVLMAANTIASVFLWPSTDQFRIADMLVIWPALLVVGLIGIALVGFDVYGMLIVNPIDEAMLEKYLDQAEYWLTGWKAPVVRLLSLGFVNPRQMVAREVRAALESTAELVNANLWWMTTSTTLRIAFGLSLWASFALQAVLRHWLGAE
jgi:hypothetical protein